MRFYKFISLLLSLIIACSLCACGFEITTNNPQNSEYENEQSSNNQSSDNQSSDNQNGDNDSTNSSENDGNDQVDDEEEQDFAFSANSGFYQEEFFLEITGGKEVYYTIDGSDPALSDTRKKYDSKIKVTDQRGYKNVFAAVQPSLISGNFCTYSSSAKEFTSTVNAPKAADVDKCLVIRAVSINEQGEVEETISGSYYIGSPTEHIQGIKESCQASGEKLAVMSLSVNYDDFFDPEYGIYVKGNIWNNEFQTALKRGSYIDAESARSFDANYKQRGREWERNCRMELMEVDENGATTVLSQDCGIRIQGNYSRSDWQKGLRLYARKEYGEKKFDYAVFGDKTDVKEFKKLVLRAGGNCAFNAKFNDAYWQAIAKQQNLSGSFQTSRPCVVYINGEYLGLCLLQEDYSDDYFEDHYGVDKDNVVVYKGDAERYELGYYIDEGELPEGVTDEKYYFNELLDFFKTHSNLKNEEDYNEFEKLVDVQGVRDYFLAQIWMNNKWDWPGKNWSMWKSTVKGEGYSDGRWRFAFYDMEFGGISGKEDIYTNTVKEDNYKPLGLLDKNTSNPAVLCFAYLMTNQEFKADFCERLLNMQNQSYNKDNLNNVLDSFIEIYSPLYEQFFKRYPGSGTVENALYGDYASAQCIRDFIDKRAEAIPSIVNWINQQRI